MHVYELMEFVVSNRSQILSIARRAGARDVERVFQDVCIAAWKHSKRAEAIRNVDAWLNVVTRNMTRNELRRDKALLARLPDTDVIDCKRLQKKKEVPSEDIELKELAQACHEAIDRLPRSYLEVVDACDLCGLSIAEFAAAKNCPVETCRTRRKRARRCLQQDSSLQQSWELFHGN